LPGIIALAIAPAIKPSTIHARMPIPVASDVMNVQPTGPESRQPTYQLRRYDPIKSGSPGLVWII
jgi:hypothetical protein